VIVIALAPPGIPRIYACRAGSGNGLKLVASLSGGQLMITSDVENFPRISDGVLGPELMERMRKAG